MRPAWATRGDPNVLGARQPGAMDTIYAHAKRLGLTVLETVTVNENSVDVVFARCGPEGTPPVVPKPDITQAITDLTDKVTAVRVITTRAREARLSLSGKMAALTESAQDFSKSTEAVLDGIAEKIALAKAKRDVAATKHHGFYDEIIKGVEDSVAVIDRLSNSPLPEGGEG